MTSYYYNPRLPLTPGGPALPPSGGLAGDTFYLTTGDSGLYVCGGLNVWTKILSTTSIEMILAPAWGTIDGTLADQADLQAELDTKGTSDFSGAYADLTGKPTLGTAAATASTDYATSVQGTTADSAVQPARTVNGHALSADVIVTKGDVGLGNADNTTDAGKPVSTVQQTALNLKANLASPTFTGTVAGVTATMVGLGNVDNTTDAGKPVSTATQTALNLKANLASPTFTGTVAGVTATMVGLSNVNNTSDASKPISTATQTAIDAKQATLVSATNIKSINGSSVLGSGDLVVAGAAAWGTVTGTLSDQTDLQTALDGKQASGSYATGTGTANGTNTGDQTITLTGNVTGSGTGSFAATIATGAVTLAKMADMATASLIYRKTAGTGAPEVQTLATLKTDLALVKADVGLGNVDNTSDANKPISAATQTALDAKQATLVSGTNIKTINGASVLGSGDLSVSASDPSYTPGSFTVATGTGRLVIKRIQLTTTQRATVAGTARLSVA